MNGQDDADYTPETRRTLGRTEPEERRPPGTDWAWSDEYAERETLDRPVGSGDAGGMMLAGRYKVLRRLGEGGMGSVWLAEDTKLDNRRVAVKMLPAVLAGKKGSYRQVKQEALMAMKLSHPNIATVRAFEEDEGGAPFLVMDYIEGTGLDDILAEKGPLGEAETRRLLGPVAAALDYAHAKGVVHRDVKPGNVIVAKDGTPFVLDFGIAREIQETMTRVTGKFSSGTLLYMSPEQLRGRAPKPAQDVYSFAAMAYECLTGAPPFSRGQIEYQIVNEAPEPLPADAAAEPLRQGIMAGLAKEPEARPSTCMGVLASGGASRPGEPEKGTTAGTLPGMSSNGGASRPGEPVAGTPAGATAGKLSGKVAGKAAETTARRDGSPHQGIMGPGAGGGGVFLQKVRVERTLEEARKEDATAGEKAELERIREVFAAGEEALKAGDHAVAAGLFGQCEPGLENWRKAVEERKERERAAAAAQQAEERRRLEEREARKEAERKRAEAEAAKNRADAVRAAKDLGGLVLAGLLVWGVATWWSKQARETAVLKTKDAVVRMGQGTREGEEKTVRMGKDAEMTFVWCPAGSFSMGSHNGDNDEKPVHEVRLTGFWMAKTEVTQKQWKSVMGHNPSHHKGNNLPVEWVSWDDCEEFCRKTGLQLPTEAEWEYACRAGTTGDYGGTGNLEAMGWYSGNSGNETNPVGTKKANAWGLHDMHGNVWEWCEDWYDSGYYAKSPGVNPKGPASGEFRVLRGGCYWSDPRRCRSAYRGRVIPGDRGWSGGFRPVARQD